MKFLKTKEQTAEVDQVKEKPEKFSIDIAIMGGDAKRIEVKEGNTLGDVVKANGWEQLEVRLNGQNVPTGTKLKENDLVVVVPQAIEGGKME